MSLIREWNPQVTTRLAFVYTRREGVDPKWKGSGQGSVGFLGTLALS
jgi:hypothetical protein